MFFNEKIPNMAAILQKSDNSNLICFQHNTAFKTKKQFDDHLLLCEKLCSQINVCNFLLTNGRMCGKTFKRTATLLIHNWRDHNIALCSNCDESFDDIEELEEHIHTYENVHERKQSLINLVNGFFKSELFQDQQSVHYVRPTLRIFPI